MSIVLRSLGTLALLGGAAAIAWGVAPLVGRPGALRTIVVVLTALALARFTWETLVWASRRYLLTERRVMHVSGVLRRYVADLPTSRLQSVVLYRSLGERVLGLGTIGFASAGTSGFEVVWSMVDRPARLLQTAREAATLGVRSRPQVIGLAGGVGAGKSEAARILGDLGCVVLDSDRAAKEALDRPDVRARLVEWWGRGVLDDGGRVDRARVAAIVFEKPHERRRLEELTHPIVRAKRAAAVERARTEGAPAVVVDAPLLFEAGVDDECDWVVFIDAPAEERARRVRETRGWSEEELARREKAQLPLDQKRSRSDEIIVNTGSRENLRAALEAALARHGVVPRPEPASP